MYDSQSLLVHFLIKTCDMKAKKIKVGSNQEMTQCKRNSHYKTRGGKNHKKALILTENIVSRVSIYFPTGDHSVART